MKRYTSCLVVAAWLCASAKADDDHGYSAPVPLREAVTARSAATDINDTSLAGSQEKPPAEVAESLRQGASKPDETNNETNLAKSGADADAPAATEEAKMSEITGTSDASAGTISETASSVAPTIAQIDETSEEPKAPVMMQTRHRPFKDTINEMMGGEFNTESNQRMAESFLSMRPRILHLKANRDL